MWYEHCPFVETIGENPSQMRGGVIDSTLQCPTDSVQNPVIPLEWHQNPPEWPESAGMALEFVTRDSPDSVNWLYFIYRVYFLLFILFYIQFN